MSQPAQSGTTRPWVVFWVASAASILAFLDATIVNVAFPQLLDDFGDSSLGGLSWVVNIYALAFAALMVVLGRAADRYGRRRVFLAAVSTFTAASVVCGAAPSVGVLIAARAVQGAAAAAMIPAALGLLLVAFAPAARVAAIGAWGAAASASAALGPSLGGILAESSWRWVFLVNVPIALAAVWVGARVLPEARTPEAYPLDLVGATLLAASTGLLALGVTQGPSWGWTDGSTLACFAGGVVAALVLAVQMRRHPAPLLEPALLRIPLVRNACLAGFLLGSALFALQLDNVLFLTGTWHYSIIRTGFALVPAPIAAMVASIAAGRSRRIRPAVLIPIGAAVFAVGVLLTEVMVDAQPDYVSSWLLGNVLAGIGIGLSIPGTAAVAASAIPPARFATGMALNTTARQLGAVVGVAVLVAVVGTPATPAEALDAFRDGWLLTAAAAGAGAVAALGLVRPHAPERAAAGRVGAPEAAAPRP